MRIPRVVRLYDGAEVLIATYSENGMPYVGLHELLNLPNINQDSEINQQDEVMLSDDIHVNRLELLHQRCGHVSKAKLLEGHRHMLFCGSGLTRHHLSKRYMKSELRHLCKSCAKAKITGRSFRATDPEIPQADKFLGKVTADISVYLNCL